jgi:tetratricopeptide (TPR) repeat protein
MSKAPFVFCLLWQLCSVPLFAEPSAMSQVAELRALRAAEARLRSALAAVERLEREIAAEKPGRSRAQKEARLAKAKEELAAARQAYELESVKAELGDQEKPFEEAMALYRARNYNEAYDRLIKLYFERKESVQIAFYTGRAAFETGRYEIAIGAFSQTIVLNPNHARAKLELARTYFVTGQTQRSKALFEEVLNGKPVPPPEVARSINMFLAEIEKRQRRHRFGGQVLMTWGYDGNVNQSSDEIITITIGDIALSLDEQAKWDTLVTLGSFNNYDYDFGETGGFQWRTSMIAYANKYTSLDENDLLLAGLKTGPSVEMQDGRLFMPLEYNRILIDGVSYMDVASLGLNYDTNLGGGAIRAHARWTERTDRRDGYRNFSENALLDSRGWEAGANWRKALWERGTVFSAGGLYASQRSGVWALKKSPFGGDKRPLAGHNALSEMDYYVLSASVTRMDTPMIYGAQASYRHSDYKNGYALFGGDKRGDNLWNAGLFLTYSLAPDTTFTANIGYAHNRSSLDFYGYEKVTAQMGLLLSWGD